MQTKGKCARETARDFTFRSGCTGGVVVVIKNVYARMRMMMEHRRAKCAGGDIHLHRTS